MKIFISTILIFISLYSVGTAQVASGFIDQVHSVNWQSPTGLAFDTYGKMFVWEKEGKVYIVENNVKTLFLDISQEVATYGDYGILNLVLDPNFVNNGHVYLYYIVDRYHLLHFGEADYDPAASWEGATIARVTRYTLPNPAVASEADYGSRLVLVGETKSTGFPITGTNHGGGGMAFGNDGTLFVACGDGGLGADYDDDALADGIISQDEYLQNRIYRCQINNSLNGKIIRINPSNGDAVPGNPYYESNNPRSKQSRVWAKGLRNPFRISVKPNSGYPGIVYVGDVGWNDREEMNVVTEAGQNFGWPHYEGMDLTTVWVEPEYIPTFFKRPTVEWRGEHARVIIDEMIHEVGSEEFAGNNFTGTCSIGGIWYTGTAFPEEYRNSYIFADFTPGWIKSMSFDGNQNPTSLRDLQSSALGIVCLAYNPIDESVYYVKMALNEGQVDEIHKISYDTGINLAPKARFTANPIYGSSPLNISFNAVTSTDPENATLTYSWDFGDGQSESGVNPSHTFDNGTSAPQSYKVILTVTDEGSLSDTTSTLISINNTPPIIHSTSIDATSFFANNGSDLISLSANVSDNEQASNELSYRWIVRLYHDEHSHPEADVTSATTQVSLPQVPCDMHLYFYRVTLKVWDSYGLITSYSKDIYPNCSTDVTPPTEPLLKLFNIDNISNTFQLSWNNATDNIGINAYEVFVNGVSKGLLSSQTLSYQYTSSTNINNQAFECYVKATDFVGNATASSKIVFTAPESSGVTAFISDITPTSSTNGFGPIEIDQSNGEALVNDGHTLMLNGVSFTKGIGTHANSEIIYTLTPNQYNVFKTKIGIDDEVSAANCGSVIFKVYKDAYLAYESPIMTPTSTTIDFQVDISNTSQLKLVVNDAGDNNYCDHGDWADAKLLFSNVSNDNSPPTTPTNLSANTLIANNYKLMWNASIDDLDPNPKYEILADGVLLITTPTTSYDLPVLKAGIHTIDVQAKDNANNRAVSKSLVLTYTPCVSDASLSSPNNNFLTNIVTLKVSNIIQATNIIEGASQVLYQAGKSIELLPGFKAEAGSVFTAKIQGCDN